MNRRFLSVILVICLLMSLVPVQVGAADTTTATTATSNKLYHVIAKLDSAPSANNSYIIATSPVSAEYYNQSAALVQVSLGSSPDTTLSTFYTARSGDITYDVNTEQQSAAFKALFDSCGGTLAYNAAGVQYSCLGGAFRNVPVHLYVSQEYTLTSAVVTYASDFYPQGTSVSKSIISSATGTFTNGGNTVTAPLDISGSGWTLGAYHTGGTVTSTFTDSSDKLQISYGGTAILTDAPNLGHAIVFTKNPSSTGTTVTLNKAPGTPIYVPDTDGTWSGHTFKGWTLTSGSSTVNYLPGSEFNVDESTTLYAVWVAIVYHAVTINGTSQQVESGTTATAPGTNPAKATEYFNGSNALIDGANDSTALAVKKITYAFAGWKNNATGQIWDFSTPVTGALTLVPEYSQTVHYKVSFDKNHAGSTYTAASQWIRAGDHVTEVTAPSTVTTGSPATNYYFAGWNTKQDGTGEYWNFYGEVVNTTLTLFAQWTTVNSYNILFDDNLADPKDDYVWNTGSLTQNSVAATGYVTAPVMSRVNYVFDGWYTDSNCNASNAYNLNRTLSDNNASGIDANQDKIITLYAKWTPKYTSENDILISNANLSGGTYATFYSDFVDAFENNASYNTNDATQVYRNFYLVHANGTLVNPSTLPAGLHLNSRTGEIYGVPTAAAGNYSFQVRIANDEGRWISLTYPITIHLANAALNLDMKDDNTGFVKTYGGNDPGFFSNQFSVTATGSPAVVYDADGTEVTLTYDYRSIKNNRAESESTFAPSTASTLRYAPDLANSIPDGRTTVFSMAFERVPGEDTGLYKLFLDADGVSGAAASCYDITVANSLLTTTLAYSEGDSPALITAPEYVFTVNAKTGASYGNGEATVPYGTYASGEDVKAALTSGSGLVSSGGIKVIDAFQSITLSSLHVSRAGKLTVGTYANGFTPIITNTASEKGTSQAAGATTTANYSSPAFSLTISTRELTAVKKTCIITAGSHFDVDALANLVSLDSLHGDFVGLTMTAVTFGGMTYDLTETEQRDAAETALASLSATVGSYPVSIAYSAVLTGSDKGNYRIAAGTIGDAALTVNAVASSGVPSLLYAAASSGTAPLLYPVVSLAKGPAVPKGTDAHGNITPNTDRAAHGNNVTLNMNPKAGYRLNGLRLLDTDGHVVKYTDNTDGTFTFRMPDKGVTYGYYFGIAAAEPELTGVSGMLETESHNAYLHGYPGGTLKPTGSMTRAEAAQMFYNLLIVKPVNPAASFLDVSPDKWYCTAVTAMAELGKINGSNGYFRPNDPITRAEFAAMTVRFAKTTDGTCDYTDVSESSWAYDCIADATAYGWLTGSNGMFRPNDNINRAEVSTIMNRMLGRVPDQFYIGDNGSTLNEFTDLTSAEWFYFDMIDATKSHAFDLTPSHLELWGNRE